MNSILLALLIEIFNSKLIYAKINVEKVYVPVSFAVTLNCLGNDMEKFKCPKNVSYEWYHDRISMNIPDNETKVNSKYEIGVDGRLLIFYVTLDMNGVIFSCNTRDNSKNEICGDHRYQIVIESCTFQTRGGIKSMCKFGSCNADVDVRNHSNFKCRCFRYYTGSFCDVPIWSSFITDSIIPWLPFVFIFVLASIGWLLATFFAGHSKKEKMFCKHKEKTEIR